jgi:hypothetical protein
MAADKLKAGLERLSAAISAAEARRHAARLNAIRGRDEHGRSPLFPSLEPGARGAVSPLDGRAKPAAEQQTKSRR